jgi:hypothetical protein
MVQKNRENRREKGELKIKRKNYKKSKKGVRGRGKEL